MMSVRILRSGPPDGDVATQLALLESLPRLRTFDEDPIRENRLSLMLASAFRLLRDRPVDCPIVTAGEAALQAASIAWRGPIVHLASAPISRLEVSLLKRRRAMRMMLVTSSQTDAKRAARRGVPDALIRVIRPALPVAQQPDRAAVRARLGLHDHQPTVLIPGTVRRGSNHRLALWAAGILIARNPNTRLLMRRDPLAASDRFAQSTLPPNARVPTRDLDDMSLAAAADVAIAVPRSAPQLSPLLSLAAVGTPIVSSASLWQRESLDALPARLLADPKPRLVAREALTAMESPRPAPVNVADLDAARRQWLSVIHHACGLLGSARESAA